MMLATRPPPLRLSELLAGLAAVDATQDRTIRGLAIDSRRICAGDCFLACPGALGHGGDYLREAVAAGAAAIALDAAHPTVDPIAGEPPLVRVRDLKSQAGVIASRFYGHPSRDLLVIGITGTNGKTSVSQYVAQVLDGFAGPCGVIGTLGNGLLGQLEPSTLTTPDPVTLQRLLADMRGRGARSVILEVSSHGLAQGRISGIALEVAAFTNLSRDHLDYHGTMAAYGEAKKLLFRQTGLRAAVLNLDDRYTREIVKDLPSGLRVRGYTLRDGATPEARPDGPHVRGSGLGLTGRGLSLRVLCPSGQGVLHSGLLGRVNASNLLASLAILLETGVPFQDAVQRLSQVAGVAGRLERFGGVGGLPLVVVDYAHTPDGLTEALRAVREVCDGRLWCVFGCGGERDRGKRPLMGRAAEELAERVILTWDNPRGEDPAAIIADILSGFRSPAGVEIEPDRAQAIAQAISQARSRDVVLVAGKGHEPYQEIAGQRLPFNDREVVQRLLGEAGR